MQVWLWMTLSATAVAMAILFVRERIRFQNYVAGKPFRDWIIENAPPVLTDPAATLAAKVAASVMLECVYDRRAIRGLRRVPGATTEVDQNGFSATDRVLAQSAGHKEFVAKGINHLIAMLMLEDTVRGLATRLMMETSSDHPFVVVKKLASNVDWKRRVQVPTEETADAISHLPIGRVVRRGLSNAVESGCSA